LGVEVSFANWRGIVTASGIKESDKALSLREREILYGELFLLSSPALIPHTGDSPLSLRERVRVRGPSVTSTIPADLP
jgi:hypothetical protein